MVLVEFITMLTLICIAGALVAMGVLASEFRDTPSSHYLHYFEDDDA